ncbi:response regulator [Thermodesulfobacteriota bacterium]
MKSLIAEDDPISRKILQAFLSHYGECNIADDGEIALESFKEAFDSGARYDFICLDIMMPNMDGRDALRNIRVYEENNGVEGLDRVKIFMTTALDDSKNIIGSFRDQCEAYLVKPINTRELSEKMKEYNLTE